MGRHSTFTPELAEEICERLAEGEPLQQICRDEHMPAWRTVYDWKDRNPELAATIARARDLGEEAILADCLRIADTPLMGERTKITADGDEERTIEDMLGHRKLQIETRLKLLAKWNPRKWGDKLDTSGEQTVKLLSDIPEEERAKRVALVLAKGIASAQAAAQFAKAREEAEDNE